MLSEWGYGHLTTDFLEIALKRDKFRYEKLLGQKNQSPMKSRFAAFLCVVAVFQVVGGHWAVLQATAWVGMLVKYSEAEGVGAGISKTFDGKHPCNLCLSIAENKQAEKKHSSQLAATKIYLVAHAQRWTLQPPCYSWFLRTPIALLIGCDTIPPVPPPRVS